MASNRRSPRIVWWIFGLPLPFILTADAANHRIAQVKEALPDYLSLADALERYDFVAAVGFVAVLIGCGVIAWWLAAEVGHVVGSLYARWPWRRSSATGDLRADSSGPDQPERAAESCAGPALPATVVIEVPSGDPVSSVIVTVAPTAFPIRLEVVVRGRSATGGADRGAKAASSAPKPNR